MAQEKIDGQALASLVRTYETRARVLEIALQKNPNNEVTKAELEQIIKQIQHMKEASNTDNNPQVK